MRHGCSHALVALLVLWSVVSIGVGYVGIRRGYNDVSFWIAIVVFAVLLAIEILLTVKAVRQYLGRLLQGQCSPFVAVAAVLLLCYITYAYTVSSLTWMHIAAATLYVTAPLTLQWSSTGSSWRWLAYAAIAIIWVPVETRWLSLLWPYPRELSYALAVLFAVALALGTFLLVRRLDGVGYDIVFTRRTCLRILFYLAVCLALVPVGKMIGFLRFNPAESRFPLSLEALFILLFVALPEELVFRGLLQNLLSRQLSSKTMGLLATAVIFGFAHIHKGKAGFPNFKYVFMATFAGIIYGRAWQKTGSVVASSMVHAFVDVVWHRLFLPS
jgi:uncharacterized protein